jgi:lysophospholipase L1-like esterase
MRMLWFYKMLLGPVLMAQGRRMRRTALRLPEAAGLRAGVISSEGNQTELRLLFVGDSAMAGVGVQNQTAALPFQVASILADQLGRSVRWQLVARSGVNTSEALEFLNGQELLPADVLITALGVNDVTSQKSPAQFIADYKELLNGLIPRIGAQFAVVNGLPPLHLTPAAPQPLRWYLGKCANRLDQRLHQWIALQQNIAYVSLQWASNPKELAEDGYHPGEGLYKKWAALVAQSIANLLAEPTVVRQAKGR